MNVHVFTRAAKRFSGNLSRVIDRILVLLAASLFSFEGGVEDGDPVALVCGGLISSAFSLFVFLPERRMNACRFFLGAPVTRRAMAAADDLEQHAAAGIGMWAM